MKLLKFGAPWCNPCQALDKTLESANLGIEIEKVAIDHPRFPANFPVRTSPEVSGMSEAQRNEGPLDRNVGRLPEYRKHGTDYLKYDPFEGDEAELTCRTVTLRKARKNHLCYGLTGERDHGIQAGEYYRHERARVDGSFWGEYRICLACMDAFIEGRY